MRGCPLLWIGLVSWVLVVAPAPVRAQNALDGVVEPALAERVRQAITQLDAAKFSQRDEAAGVLEQLGDDPLLAPFMVGEYQRTLLVPETSFEVRARLERLLKKLPSTPTEKAAKPEPGEIEALLDKLNDDSSARRDSARRRLSLML